MKLLHTSDWHVGKRLDRYDRMDEHRQVIDEVVAIADREKVDAVIHSGDLFDRAVPPVEALRLGLDGLVRLAADGTRPVVVVAGNHDSPQLFDTLAPFLRPFGVHLVGSIKSPADGGILSLDAAAGRLLVACFPFLRAAQVVDFMAKVDDWYGTYAERVRKITEAYARGLAKQASEDDVTVLAGHYMVGGVKVRTGIPRGERDLHIGEAYAATEAAVPTAVDYVALGHIHAPQSVPGANVPAEYAGSLLQLDFGEAGEIKRVVIVEAKPGVPAKLRSVPIEGGRRLIRVEGTWADIVERDDLEGALLDLVIHTDGPEEGLMDRVRERFPDVVKVRPVYERQGAEPAVAPGATLEEMYTAYHLEAHASVPSDALIDLFREISEEVADATG